MRGIDHVDEVGSDHCVRIWRSLVTRVLSATVSLARWSLREVSDETVGPVGEKSG